MAVRHLCVVRVWALVDGGLKMRVRRGTCGAAQERNRERKIMERKKGRIRGEHADIIYITLET